MREPFVLQEMAWDIADTIAELRYNGCLGTFLLALAAIFGLLFLGCLWAAV